MAATSGIATPSLSTKTPLKSAIPAHLQREIDFESPALSTPGSAKTYGESSESISSINEDYDDEAHDTSDESLGIRKRRERADAGELAVGSPVSSISEEKDNENSASNTSKSSGNDSHNTSIHSEISVVVAQAPPDASSATPEFENNAKQISKTVQTAAGSAKQDDEDEGDDDARMLPPPSPSIRSFMLEYKNEPHPRSPVVTPAMYTKTGEHQVDTVMSPKLEAIDEVTEEMTTFEVNLTPALEKAPRSEIQASKLRQVHEVSEDEGEDGDVSEISQQSSLLEILSPLAQKSSSHPKRPAITSTPSFISAKDGNKANLQLLTDSAFSSPIAVLSHSSHRELPPLPSPAEHTPYDDESVEITLGSEGIKDILWNVPNLEKDDYEIKTPEMEAKISSFPFPATGSRVDSAAFPEELKRLNYYKEMQREDASATIGAVPVKKSRSRTITHTAENQPPKERSIPVLMGPNALPYARCPSGIDAYAFNLDDTDPYEAAYPVPGPVHVRQQSTERDSRRHVPIMTATAPTPIRDGDTGETFGDGRSRTTSSNSSVSSAGTATTANIRARQRSEQLHNLTLKRDQARIEQEGRRETARILRSIQDEERLRSSQTKKDAAAERSQDVFDVNAEHAGWYYDSMAGGWKRRDSLVPHVQTASHSEGRRSADEERTPRLTARSESQAHLPNTYIQPAAPRTSTAYARERARASHPIQTLLAANQARARQLSTPSSDAGHSRSRLNSRAPPFQYPGYLPNDPRLAQLPKHQLQGVQQVPAMPYSLQYGYAGIAPAGLDNFPGTAFSHRPFVESKMDPRLFEMLQAQQMNAHISPMNAQTSAQIAHKNHYLPSAPCAILPPEAFRKWYPDAGVVAAIQQSNARLAQMIAQTQQQMEQLQLFQAYQKANQGTSAPPSLPFTQEQTSAIAKEPVNTIPDILPEAFTSAQRTSPINDQVVHAKPEAPLQEAKHFETSHKLSFPPGLPFPIYTKAPERRLAQGPESDPAVIASFRKAPAAVLPPLLPAEAKESMSAKPAHSKLDSIDAARKRVEQAMEEAKQQSAKAATSLPPKPEQHALSNRLLGIIPSGASDNKTIQNPTDTDPLATPDRSLNDSVCTNSSVVAAARRRVRSNAPSPEEMYTPARRSAALSSGRTSTVTRSAPLRAPQPKTQLSGPVPTSDPKPRRYTASMRVSSTPRSSCAREPEGKDKKPANAPTDAARKDTGMRPPGTKLQEQTSRGAQASTRRKGRVVNRGWTDFVEKMGGVPSAKD